LKGGFGNQGFLYGDKSILVYAYILIYCFKELGFENEGFGGGSYLKAEGEAPMR